MRHLIFLLLLIACNSPNRNTNTTEASPNLLGIITRSDLQEPSYKEWFSSGYDSYQVDKTSLADVNLNNFEILTFMGTWCSDSRREIPNFYKILDHLDFNKMTVIAVDKDKTEPAEEIQKWNIKYVPTFIILKNGAEINRIIESPKETLEKDIAALLNT